MIKRVIALIGIFALSCGSIGWGTSVPEIDTTPAVEQDLANPSAGTSIGVTYSPIELADANIGKMVIDLSNTQPYKQVAGYYSLYEQIRSSGATPPDPAAYYVVPVEKNGELISIKKFMADLNGNSTLNYVGASASGDVPLFKSSSPLQTLMLAANTLNYADNSKGDTNKKGSAMLDNVVDAVGQNGLNRYTNVADMLVCVDSYGNLVTNMGEIIVPFYMNEAVMNNKIWLHEQYIRDFYMQMKAGSQGQVIMTGPKDTTEFFYLTGADSTKLSFRSAVFKSSDALTEYALPAKYSDYLIQNESYLKFKLAKKTIAHGGSPATEVELLLVDTVTDTSPQNLAALKAEEILKNVNKTAIKALAGYVKAANLGKYGDTAKMNSFGSPDAGGITETENIEKSGQELQEETLRSAKTALSDPASVRTAMDKASLMSTYKELVLSDKHNSLLYTPVMSDIPLLNATNQWIMVFGIAMAGVVFMVASWQFVRGQIDFKKAVARTFAVPLVFIFPLAFLPVMSERAINPFVTSVVIDNMTVTALLDRQQHIQYATTKFNDTAAADALLKNGILLNVASSGDSYTNMNKYMDDRLFTVKQSLKNLVYTPEQYAVMDGGEILTNAYKAILRWEFDNKTVFASIASTDSFNPKQDYLGLGQLVLASRVELNIPVDADTGTIASALGTDIAASNTAMQQIYEKNPLLFRAVESINKKVTKQLGTFIEETGAYIQYETMKDFAALLVTLEINSEFKSAPSAIVLKNVSLDTILKSMFIPTNDFISGKATSLPEWLGENASGVTQGLFKMMLYIMGLFMVIKNVAFIMVGIIIAFWHAYIRYYVTGEEKKHSELFEVYKLYGKLVLAMLSMPLVYIALSKVINVEGTIRFAPYTWMIIAVLCMYFIWFIWFIAHDIFIPVIKGMGKMALAGMANLTAGLSGLAAAGGGKFAAAKGALGALARTGSFLANAAKPDGTRERGLLQKMLKRAARRKVGDLQQGYTDIGAHQTPKEMLNAIRGIDNSLEDAVNPSAVTAEDITAATEGTLDARERVAASGVASSGVAVEGNTVAVTATSITMDSPAMASAFADYLHSHGANVSANGASLSATGMTKDDLVSAYASYSNRPEAFSSIGGMLTEGAAEMAAIGELGKDYFMNDGKTFVSSAMASALNSYAESAVSTDGLVQNVDYSRDVMGMLTPLNAETKAAFDNAYTHKLGRADDLEAQGLEEGKDFLRVGDLGVSVSAQGASAIDGAGLSATAYKNYYKMAELGNMNEVMAVLDNKNIPYVLAGDSLLTNFDAKAAMNDAGRLTNRAQASPEVAKILGSQNVVEYTGDAATLDAFQIKYVNDNGKILMANNADNIGVATSFEQQARKYIEQGNNVVTPFSGIDELDSTCVAVQGGYKVLGVGAKNAFDALGAAGIHVNPMTMTATVSPETAGNATTILRSAGVDYTLDGSSLAIAVPTVATVLGDSRYGITGVDGMTHISGLTQSAVTALGGLLGNDVISSTMFNAATGVLIASPIVAGAVAKSLASMSAASFIPGIDVSSGLLAGMEMGVDYTQNSDGVTLLNEASRQKLKQNQQNKTDVAKLIQDSSSSVMHFDFEETITLAAVELADIGVPRILASKGFTSRMNAIGALVENVNYLSGKLYLAGAAVEMRGFIEAELAKILFCIQGVKRPTAYRYVSLEKLERILDRIPEGKHIAVNAKYMFRKNKHMILDYSTGEFVQMMASELSPDLLKVTSTTTFLEELSALNKQALLTRHASKFQKTDYRGQLTVEALQPVFGKASMAEAYIAWAMETDKLRIIANKYGVDFDVAYARALHMFGADSNGERYIRDNSAILDWYGFTVDMPSTKDAYATASYAKRMGIDKSETHDLLVAAKVAEYIRQYASENDCTFDTAVMLFKA